MKYIYVDNSNLWICGGDVAAVRKGLSCDVNSVTIEQRIEAGWRIDYAELYKLVSDGKPSSVGCAKLWGSEPPSDPFWNVVRNGGFEAKYWPRNAVNKEKGVDASITFEIGSDSAKISPTDDEIILVSGDGDFAKPVELLRSKGYRVKAYGWSRSARALRDACSEFIELDQYFDRLTFRSK